MSDILLHFQHCEDTCGSLKHEELSSTNEEGGNMLSNDFQTEKQQKCNCWIAYFNWNINGSSLQFWVVCFALTARMLLTVKCWTFLNQEDLHFVFKGLYTEDHCVVFFLRVFAIVFAMKHQMDITCMVMAHFLILTAVISIFFPRVYPRNTRRKAQWKFYLVSLRLFAILSLSPFIPNLSSITPLPLTEVFTYRYPIVYYHSMLLCFSNFSDVNFSVWNVSAKLWVTKIKYWNSSQVHLLQSRISMEFSWLSWLDYWENKIFLH